MRVAKVRPEGYAWMAFNLDKELDSVLETVKDLLVDLPEDDTVVIEVVEMSEEEFDSLSEFDGW